VSPQIGLHPLPITNAAVNAPNPPDVTAEFNIVALDAVRSTYGATPYPVAADALPAFSATTAPAPDSSTAVAAPMTSLRLPMRAQLILSNPARGSTARRRPAIVTEVPTAQRFHECGGSFPDRFRTWEKR
jgi:hypothetical protein